MHQYHLYGLPAGYIQMLLEVVHPRESVQNSGTTRYGIHLLVDRWPMWRHTSLLAPWQKLSIPILPFASHFREFQSKRKLFSPWCLLTVILWRSLSSWTRHFRMHRSNKLLTSSGSSLAKSFGYGKWVCLGHKKIKIKEEKKKRKKKAQWSLPPTV